MPPMLAAPLSAHVVVGEASQYILQLVRVRRVECARTCDAVAGQRGPGG